MGKVDRVPRTKFNELINFKGNSQPQILPSINSVIAENFHRK